MQLLMLLFAIGVCAGDVFEEQLTLRPLPNRYVQAYFQLTTKAESSQLQHGHYHLFPKALGEILVKYNVSELEVSLTQGMWRYNSWGLPLKDSTAAPGAEILAIFAHGTVDVARQWKDLVNSLSGLVCASFNFIDESVTVQPAHAFQPRGAQPLGSKLDQSLMRYALLPQENVCTENLTPWLKLAPCHGQAGLSSLFSAKALFDSSYHSMSLRVMPVCADETCSTQSLKLSQSLSVVYEPVLRSGRQDRWSLVSLFGRAISKRCEVASVGRVLVEHAAVGALALDLEPPPLQSSVDKMKIRAEYTVSSGFNLTAAYKLPEGYQLVPSPAVHAHRYIAGYGREHGSLVCRITNNLDIAVQIVYMTTVPWFLRVYLHTLAIEGASKSIKPSKMVYAPGKERLHPYLLELLLELPANSTTAIKVDFEYLFLKWTEYPPDANHGFYIPPAVISVALPGVSADVASPLRDNRGVVRLYTEKLLVSLPTPDFSMPYNVICLTCTVVAIGFGSLHNLITKTFVADFEKTSFMKKCLLFCKQKLARLGLFRG